MRNQFLKDLLKVATEVGSKHGSTILAGIAVGGVILTGILAAMARPKADERIDKAGTKKSDEEIAEAEKTGKEIDLSQVGKLTFWEKVKAAIPSYIPVIIAGVLTVACIVGGHIISLRKIGDLAATCNVLQMANDRYEKYAEEVKKELGEEKEAEVRAKADEQAAKEVASSPMFDEVRDVIITGDGNTLFWDPYAGRYFRSSTTALEMAAIGVNKLGQQSRWAVGTLEEFYFKAHFEGNKIPKMADRLKWNIEESLVEMCLNNTTISEWGEPCIIMEFRVEPEVGIHTWASDRY